VDVDAFFAHIKIQTEKTGVRGVHLVDEAAPPASLLRLALLNREAGLPFNFWGNIRFDKGFTPDTAALLAAGGLTGVSGGIEIAAEKGFAHLCKGIALRDVVRASAAFKEEGILTHGYLIFGYWDQDEQEIIDSAEIVRQLFAHGLLDSAFWHKFILTRHSRLYAEKQKGLHNGLTIIPFDDSPGRFALNDLSFEGEQKFDKYTEPLDRLLSTWMAGNTDAPVASAFPFKVKKPQVPADQVQSLLDEYARDRDKKRAALPVMLTEGNASAAKVIFLGSLPVVHHDSKEVLLIWRRRLEEHRVKTETKEQAEKLAGLLNEAGGGDGIDMKNFYQGLEDIVGQSAANVWKKLRNGGLTVFLQPAI
jgi:hypothetical protein